MAKQKEITWQETIDGIVHDFALMTDYSGKGKAIRILSIDGQQVASAPVGSSEFLTGSDISFEMGGRKMNLVVAPNGKKADVVVDGYYLSNGKSYTPLPTWIWAFLVLNMALLFVGGALGAAIGFLGAGICLKIGRISMNAAAKIGICLAVTILAWIGYFAIGFMLVGGINGLLS